MRRLLHACVLASVLTAGTTTAGTRLFMSDTTPWLVDNADIAFEATSGRLLARSPGDTCVTLALVVGTTLKGNTANGSTIVAVYHDGRLTESCSIDTDCPALAQAMVYLAEQPSRVCQNVGAAVLDITEAGSGKPLPIVAARDYLEAENKVAWAEKAIERVPEDSDIARAAIAATLSTNESDPAVRRLLRAVTLSDGIDESVRFDALRVLQVTQSPERLGIIRDLMKTEASPQLKRDALRQLDGTPGSAVLLQQLRDEPKVGGYATALLLAHSQSLSPSVRPSLAQLPVEEPSETAFAQFLTITNSTLDPSAKQEAVSEVLQRLSKADQQEFSAKLIKTVLPVSTWKLINSVNIRNTEAK